MSYSAVVNLIRDAAEVVNTGGTFIHGRRSDGSIEYDAPFPQVHLYPFISRLDVNQVGIYTTEIIMAFWQQDAPDTSNEDREQIIAQMDTLSNEFLTELNAQQCEVINVRKEPQYRSLSGTLSGYAITFTLNTFTSPC